jgi:hypothetical protein
MGKPADYGHRDQWVSLSTDGDGRFGHRFEPVTYSVTHWLFPPLGPSPRDPPKPVVGLRTRLPDGAWFIVYVEGETSRAVRFREQPVERTPLPGGAGKPTVTLRPAADGAPPGWAADVSVALP